MARTARGARERRWLGRPATVFASALLLAGCAGVLPRQEVATQETWHGYATAKAAIEAIVPMQTTRAQLSESGIDPETNAAVTILSYSDIVQRLGVGAAISAEDLDAGVRWCLTAGKACTGYAVALRRTNRRRVGNFWLDTFNFRRETRITGWSFNALVLFVDGLVVYTLQGGQPRVHERELVRNPLGPLQGWGELAGARAWSRN